MRDPIIITGAARSGTSMVAGLVARSGALFGLTQPGNDANPKGFYENADVRQRCIKGALKEGGGDPMGVKNFPAPAFRPSFDLRACVHKHHGYAGDNPWAFKAVKALPIWRAWMEAFPDAYWILVRRPCEDVVASCLRQDMMNQHSQDPAFWRRWWQQHQDWMASVREAAPEGHAFDVHSQLLVDGDFRELTEAIRHAKADHPELMWQPYEARAWIDKSLFRGAIRESVWNLASRS